MINLYNNPILVCLLPRPAEIEKKHLVGQDAELVIMTCRYVLVLDNRGEKDYVAPSLTDVRYA